MAGANKTNKHYSYKIVPKGLKDVLDGIVALFEKELKDNLVGIYLHGSLAMGSFSPHTSDIDFLAVVKNKLSMKEKKHLILGTIVISKDKHVPPKGIEFSIIQEKFAQSFVYPTPYELHYSKDWHEAYLKNLEGQIAKQDNETDKDLAAHMTVIYHRGIKLAGKPKKDVFAPVPEKHYWNSLLYDIEKAEEKIVEEPAYYVLNLCRVLAYRKHGYVYSKTEAAEWAKKNLPEKFKVLVDNAMVEMAGKYEKIIWNGRELITFAQYILNEIDLIGEL